MKKVVESIENKVNNIISLYNSLKKEKEEILEENKKLRSDISERDKSIKSLEEKINLLRISKSVGALDVEKNMESPTKNK